MRSEGSKSRHRCPMIVLGMAGLIALVGTTPGYGLNVRLVGQIGGTSYSVAVAGNRAFLSVGPRLVILDVTQPAAPVVLGQTAPLPNVIQGVTLSGTYAYVADWD